MSMIAAGIGILLSLIFLVSGVSKVLDREGTASGFYSLRIPFASAHKALATIVPILEIAVGILLWLPWQGLAIAAALVALLLMLAFTVVIARAMQFEEAVHCSCFGKLGSPTVGRPALIRNILLSVLALASFIFTLTSPAFFLGRTLTLTPQPTITLLILTVLTAALTALILGGTRTETQVSRAASAPVSDTSVSDDEFDYIRTPIPFAFVEDAQGAKHSLRKLASRKAVLLLFLSTGCGSCTTIFPLVPSWKKELGHVMDIYVVTAATWDQLGEERQDLLGDAWMHDPEGHASQIFEIQGWPSAVLLGADGMLAGGPVTGGGVIQSFVDDIKEQLGELGTAPETQDEDPIEGEVL